MNQYQIIKGQIPFTPFDPNAVPQNSAVLRYPYTQTEEEIEGKKTGNLIFTMRRYKNEPKLIPGDEITLKHREDKWYNLKCTVVSAEYRDHKTYAENEEDLKDGHATVVLKPLFESNSF